MMWPNDWNGLCQEKARSREVEFKKQCLLAQVPRQRPRWQRLMGSWLIRTGGRLTAWGQAMTECECKPQLPATP